MDKHKVKVYVTVTRNSIGNMELLRRIVTVLLISMYPYIHNIHNESTTPPRPTQTHPPRALACPVLEWWVDYSKHNKLKIVKTKRKHQNKL